MKGVILAGGTGSRLDPLTRVTNKHLLPIGKKPMIFHTIELLRDAFNITDIMIIMGKENAGDFLKLLGSGSDLHVELTYRIQDKAGGIAEALGLCETFASSNQQNNQQNNHTLVLLGDNIFLGEFENISLSKDEAAIFLKEVADPQRFGCPQFGEGNEKGEIITNIIEKPKSPPSNYAVTGLYIYPQSVFEVIKGLKPSLRGELEITDVNNYYLKQQKLKHFYFQGSWTDAGTFESMHKANRLFMDEEE